jgi:uncharacterized protein YcnI
MRRCLATALVAAAAVLAPAAAAHVQVLPAEVAPGDPTLFTVLVPNESDKPTVSVALKIPNGVIPFSFQETPEWTRIEKRKANQSLDVVTWKGSLGVGEFVEFSFLATTPDVEGTITWPAVQTYEGGEKVRWIGAPDSEEPAPQTVVSKSVAPQNAGGEGASAAVVTTAQPDAEAVAPPSTGEGGSSSTLAIVALLVGAAGLVAALIALALGRRERGASGSGDADLDG